MSEAVEKSQNVREWFEKTVKPVLERWSPERAVSLSERAERLTRLESTIKGEVSVCVLGQSGVGKSTLLNALVAGTDLVLPAGGIGPLTAQETRVSYSEIPSFRVEYLPRQKLWNLAFGLEKRHEADLRRAGATVQGSSDELASKLSKAEVLEPLEKGESDPSDARFVALQRLAHLLVKGQQFQEAGGQLPYLLDALRTAMGMKPRWGHAVSLADASRIDGIRQALALAGSKTPVMERRAGADPAVFHRELHDHAAGYLSPLIKTLDVGWNSEILRSGVVLVDLPGVGVANDDYVEVTKRAVRQARCIILVVDRAGLPTEAAELLRDTGFLVSLLHEAGDPTAQPVVLMVGIVKLDLTVDEAYQLDRQNNPASFRKWREHLQDAYSAAITMVRSQLRRELEKIADAGPAETLADRRGVIDRVLESLQVHPVLAREYRSLLSRDEDMPARIKSVEESNVPRLATALTQLPAERRERLEASLTEATKELRAQAAGALEIVREQWKLDGRAKEEIESLKIDLEALTTPLDIEFRSRQGAFREFLRQSLPKLIEASIGEAVANAKNDILRHLRKYEEYPWATIRAAVRRSGVFDGARYVNLPSELTERLEEPIAVVWAKEILTELRRRTAALGNDHVEMVGEIVSWTRQQGARVQPKLVEALHEELKSNARELAIVGKEEIAKLRDKVREELNEKIEEQVRRGCKQFCDSNQDIGPGVKLRMLTFFREGLSDSVVNAAKPVAIKVLKDNYKAVQEEIDKLAKKYPNPVSSAQQTILEAHANRVIRVSTQKRQQVMAEVEAALLKAPKV